MVYKFAEECGIFMLFFNFLKLVATLHSCTTAICDRTKQSAEGAIQAVIEFVTKRGNELSETDVSRFLVYKFSRNSSRLKLLTVICKYFLVRVIISVFRTTQSLLSAAVHITDKHLRLETLGAVSFFA